MAYAARILALATIYVLAARAGLAMDAVSGFASLVWAPTGIAIASLLLGGYRYWPAVAAGAFVANTLSGAPALAALGIATGNTLEAVAATYGLRRTGDFDPAFDRLSSVTAFIVIACVASTAISATIGVSSLYAGGLVPPGRFGETWQAWWLGDAIGALLVAPLILVWFTRPLPPLRARVVIEGALLLLAVALVSVYIFTAPARSATMRIGHTYLFFPLLIIAAVRLGQRGAVTGVFLVSAIAIGETALGRGPFAHATLAQSLLALQTFMGLAAATFMVLAASIAELRAARDELQRAHDTVATANRAKSEFLAVMSHELRTPLNAIAGYADMLKIGIDGELNERQRETVDRIERNERHLLRLIEDVLNFARIEAGTLTLHIQPVRVCDAVESVRAVITPELRRKEQTLDCGASSSDETVLADPEKLEQILLNLAANAVKFTEPGGTITMRAFRDGANVRIAVGDTGIGIEPEKLQRVFEPFVQLDAGATRRYSGVGLGLAIARDLALRMGGEMAIESEPGRGTTVTLVLPAAPTPTRSSPEASS